MEKRSCSTCIRGDTVGKCPRECFPGGPNYPAWEPVQSPRLPDYRSTPRSATIDCKGRKCQGRNCSSCFPKKALQGLCAPKAPTLPEARPSLPEDAQARLEYPMADGLLDYFPNALAEVSRLSFVATQQHHPDAGMHWDRSKSLDHRNKIMRHLVDTGKVDDKGMRHSAMVAWRALALLQTELEEAEGLPPSRASRNAPVYQSAAA